MKHLIVPVDLSGNSKDALRYAAKLAAASGADILIVHCFTLLQKVVSHTRGKSDTMKDPEKWILKRIKKLEAKHPDLKIDYRIIRDDVLSSLKKIVADTDSDLVVMGCQGENENESTFLGSTSGAMVKTTEIPVLLVPRGYKFNGIGKVVFAAKDTFVRFMGALEPVIMIKQIFKPHVQLLHLGADTSIPSDTGFSILQVINDITRYGNDNFNESINEYLSQHEADLLCVIRRKRGMLEKMLSRSKTPVKKFSVHIPVLVLIAD